MLDVGRERREVRVDNRSYRGRSKRGHNQDHTRCGGHNHPCLNCGSAGFTTERRTTGELTGTYGGGVDDGDEESDDAKL